jgi:hypothetical protein
MPDYVPQAGDKVRVRRYEVQDGYRELAAVHEGTVGMTDRYGLRLDPEPGYIGTGYVFLGMQHQGTARNLVTEVELMEESGHA